MSGRAVNKDLTNKEGQTYNAWVQMDFKETDISGNYKMKQFHQNYGFDLEKVLANHPIKELMVEQDKSRLIDSLNKGNRQSVTFIENGSEHKRFVEANPQFKSISIYDVNMQRLVSKQSRGEREHHDNVMSAKQDVKKDQQRQGDSDGDSETPRTSKKRIKKGQGV
jgi:hypothetical protein